MKPPAQRGPADRAGLPEDTVVQDMPRAPVSPPEAPPSTAMTREGHLADEHPLAMHHDRISTAHEAFLRGQDEVHRGFIAHRARLLEGLQRLWTAPFAVSPEPVSPEDGYAETRPHPVEPHAPEVAAAGPVLAAAANIKVAWDDWFLDAHVAPVGVLVEPIAKHVSGSPADVECDVEFFSGLPEVGETIGWAAGTSADGFVVEASVGDRRIVRVAGRRTARRTPSSVDRPRGPGASGPPAPATWTSKGDFTEREVAALLDGDPFGCFGEGFERSASHTRTPPLPGARLIRLARVLGLDPTGGPRQAGALRARVAPAFEALPPREDAGLRLARIHQGALQCLAFFAAAAGATIERDGWRFEPLLGQAARVRFAAAPDPEESLEYEVAIERLEIAQDTVVIGDVRCLAGDRVVFEGERLGLRLVPDWPLTSDRALMADGAKVDAGPRAAAEVDGFRIGYASLLAGALGRPSHAFRDSIAAFENGQRQMPRLPGPPYHFITRVAAVEGERLSMKPGVGATMEYDVPADAWYLDENGNRTMPYCVLLEAALQPCGWLSVYVGAPLSTSENVFFRNLDGTGLVMTGEVFGGCTLRTHAVVTSVTQVSGQILISYKIECAVEDRPVCHLRAMFGYHTKEALAMQVGLRTTDQQRAALVEPCDIRVELGEQPPRFFAGEPRMPASILLMADRITGLWPSGGAAGKGRIRGEKTVEPHDWFFRSHFFSDPVQPGSLGLEMMLQLLQFFAIDRDLAKGMDHPYFEPLALGAPVSWKFRGQVRPENGHVVTDVDIVSIEAGPEGVLIVADGSLWVDGVRCYEAKGIATRIRPGRAVAERPATVSETVVDPTVDKWVADHRPSYTVPVMPGMGLVDRLAVAALEYVKARYPGAKDTPEWHVVDVWDVRHHGWLVCDEAKRLRTEVTLVNARAVHSVDEVDVAATMFEVTDRAAPPRRVTAGRIRVSRRFGAPPRAWPPLAGATQVQSPYETGSIFWGPKLQLLRRLAIGAHGATAELDAAGADAPIGAVHPILLDGTLHAVPHDELERWCDKIPVGYMGVPMRLTARFFGPPPRRGKMRAEIRFVGFDGASAFPAFGIQIIDAQDRVWVEMRHVEVLVPMGNRNVSRDLRIPFLVQRRFHEGAGLSQFHANRTELDLAEVKRMDALPGSVAHVYELPRGVPVDPRVIAIKDHVGQRARVHPGRVHVDEALSEGRCDELPLTRFPVSVEAGDTTITVRDAGPPAIDGARFDEAARRLDPRVDEATLAELHATVTGLRVTDPAVLASARAVVLLETDVRRLERSESSDDTTDRHRLDRVRPLLPALSAAAGARAVQAIAAGEDASLAGAVAEARAFLEGPGSEGQGWVVFLIDDAKGFLMKDLRGPVADMAASTGAVLLPVSAHPSDGGTEYRVGAPIPPDDLRLLDHL